MWLIFALIFFGLVYDWLTTLWIYQWLRGVSVAPGPSTRPVPISFFRAIKRDVPNLASKLNDFLAALDQSDQALFGVDDSDSASRLIVQQALAAFPHLDTTLILCRPNLVPNPKVNKLIQLAPLAQHEHWIVLDSEIENCATFLPSFRQEWANLTSHLCSAPSRIPSKRSLAGDIPPLNSPITNHNSPVTHPASSSHLSPFTCHKSTPILSAPYRFRRLDLETFPLLATLLPGLAVLQRTANIRLTLGACMAVTRTQVKTLGGWEAFGNYLAEDYQLGHQAAKQNIPVALSTTIATLDNDLFPTIHNSPVTNHASISPFSTSHLSPITYHASALLKLHRIAVTYRVCNPWGFAGSLCNHTPFWCLLLIGQIPNRFVIALLLLTFFSRILTVALRARFIRWPVPFIDVFILTIPSAILETLVWFASWFPLPVYWNGRFRRLGRNDTLGW